jgi:hypothetical protein
MGTLPRAVERRQLDQTLEAPFGCDIHDKLSIDRIAMISMNIYQQSDPFHHVPESCAQLVLNPNGL